MTTLLPLHPTPRRDGAPNVPLTGQRIEILGWAGVSVGDGDTTLEGQTNKSTFGIESAVADRVSPSNRTPPQRRR
jgi:hypothetical protein